MDAMELKRRLGEILTIEEFGSPPDWVQVEHLSHRLETELDVDAPTIVHTYLHGVQYRKADPVFGAAQRAELLRYLRK